jgi:hypothetical protein
MANEITARVGLEVLKSGVPEISKIPAQFKITMTGTDLILSTQAIGTAAEAIVKGEVSTIGMCLFHNLDATNYVEIGHDVSAAFEADIRINAGEWCLVRLTQGTPQARANTAAVQIEYFMIEA